MKLSGKPSKTCSGKNLKAGFGAVLKSSVEINPPRTAFEDPVHSAATGHVRLYINDLIDATHTYLGTDLTREEFLVCYSENVISAGVSKDIKTS